MRIQKGGYGYINNRKRKALTGVLLMAAAGIAVFIAGLLLNKMSNRNIFSVIAVLFVLPGAKYLVRFIVTFPYHSADREVYNRVKEHTGSKMQLYADMLVTSPEKVMFLDFIAVGNKQVIALASNKKQEIQYIRKYLSDGVHNWGDGYKVKILDNEKSFLREIDNVAVQETDKEEEANVKSYLTSLVV
ncbi:MAG: hypothetical protein OSJ45_16125 [Lachnospiraceae bacterium]|nr:hypothetical protein [Lachnospiraceae bacterium]